MWIRCGFFFDQLITEIYPHQLECESTVNTPAPSPSPRGTSLFSLNLYMPLNSVWFGHAGC